MTALWVLLGVVAVVVLAGVLKWRLDGRFRDSTPRAADVETLTAEQIGAALGERVTLVQFSTSFCSPCRATRILLADVVAEEPGVVHVEMDAESNLDLVRHLRVLRTPTVLVLDAAGRVMGRASGLPERHQVLAAIAAASPASAT